MKSHSKAQFLKILDEHSKIINSLCSIYYDSSDDQKDARQDVVLQLWKSFPTFRAEAQLSTWIYRITLNTLLNKKKKEARSPGTESLTDIAQSATHAVRQADDDLQLLKQMIGLLPDIEKAVMVLHLEGYQHKEIGQMLSLSASNVSTRLYRIKTRLKENFKTQPYVAR